MSVELNTIAPKKWVANYSGAKPIIDTTDGVRVGDYAIDTSNDAIWHCLDNTDTAAVWVLLGDFGVRAAELIVFDFTTDIATGDGKAYFVCPSVLNGKNLTGAYGRVITVGTTGSTDIQVHNVTDAVDMLSSKIVINSGSQSDDGVVNGSNDDVITNDLLRIDVDAVSTTAPKGLLIVLTFDDP
jgi:hypothetical protein